MTIGLMVASTRWAKVDLAAEQARRKESGGEGLLFGYEEMDGDFAKIPDEAAPGEGFERVVSDVDFPPEEALPSAGHVMVMIVVPAFAEGHESKEPVVAAGVRGLVTA